MAILNKTIIYRDSKKGKSDYTPINNSILQSSTLTPNEKSILVHLLSLPKNFAIIKGNIWKKMRIGRDAFNKAWKGLETFGYIKSERIMDKGIFVGWLHEIYETPINGNTDLLNIRHSEIPTFGKSVKIKKKECTKEVDHKRSSLQKSTCTPDPRDTGSELNFKQIFEMGIDVDVREYLKSN
jgi:hypothetical protein